MLVSYQNLVPRRSVILPGGEGEDSPPRHHQGLESGRHRVAGKGMRAVLEVVARGPAAGDLVGIGLNQDRGAPEGGGSDMPVGG